MGEEKLLLACTSSSTNFDLKKALDTKTKDRICQTVQDIRMIIFMKEGS